MLRNHPAICTNLWKFRAELRVVAHGGIICGRSRRMASQAIGTPLP
jgi:hypothetical protein